MRKRVASDNKPSGDGGEAPPPPQSKTEKVPLREKHGLPVVATLFLALWMPFIGYLALEKPRMWVVFGSSAVFFAYNRAALPLTRLFWPGVDSLHPDKKDGWVNLVVSVVHAFCLSVMSVYCTVTFKELYKADIDWLRPSVELSWLPFASIALSLGYCAVDTFDMIENGQAIRFSYLMLHHGAILLTFTIACYQDLGLLYLVLTMLCEINTVFLHTRVMMGFAGWTRQNSFAARAALWGVFTSMYVARLPVHAYLLVRVIADRKYWPTDELWITGVSALIVFNVLNYQLNKNLSKTYAKARAKDTSKRVIAIDVLAHKVWPVLSVVGGAMAYTYFHDLFEAASATP